MIATMDLVDRVYLRRWVVTRLWFKTLCASRLFRALPPLVTPPLGSNFVKSARPEFHHTHALGIGPTSLGHLIMRPDYVLDLNDFTGYIVRIEEFMRHCQSVADSSHDRRGRRPGGLRHSLRLEGQDTVWWTDTIAKWRAYHALVAASLETFYEGGLMALVRMLAEREPDAFWQTYWTLLFDPSLSKRCENFLCDTVLSAHRDACIAALDKHLDGLRKEDEGRLSLDGVCRAFLTLGVHLDPLRHDLMEPHTHAMRDLPPRRRQSIR